MLILKENAANSVPTPPVGKDTFFIDDSGVPSIKNSDGNVTTFPTVNASNAQVVFMNGSALSGEAALTYDFNNNILNISGNLAAGNVKTDNLLYANGTPWDLQQPGGSNTQIQFNDADQFGGSAALTFNKSSNLVSMGGALSVTGNANVGNLGTAQVLASANVTAPQLISNVSTGTAPLVVSSTTRVANLDVAKAGVANTVNDAAQPNITSVGTLTSLSVTGTASAGNLSTGGNLSVSGNAVISGNLTVDGNLVYVNVDTLAVEDPIINLQTGPNGAAPIANSGKDVGSALNYYDTQARIAFMGWDVSNAEFAFGSQTSITNEVVTFSTLGNARAQTFKGNVEAAGTSNIAAVNLAGHIIPTVDDTYDLGNSTNRFRDLWVSGNSIRIGNSRITSNATSLVLQNPDGGQVVVSGNSISSSTTIVNGNSNVNIPSANGNVNISATGVANVLVITSTGANVTGTLNATGNANVGNLGTAGLITATGNVSGGNLTTAGVVAATGNVSGGNLTTAGALSVTGNANVGNLGTAGLITATGNVSGGNLTTAGVVAATGNVSGGNLTTAGALSVTGNANTGNLGTTTLIATTGNITTINSGLLQNGNSNIAITANGNVSIQAAGSTVELVVTSTGANISGTLNATGNANVGNIGAAAGVFTGNISSLNANLGNLVAANVANLVDLNVTGNANIGGGSGGNISGANVITANTFVGNLQGQVANGNSNVSIPAANGNVNISAVGTANVIVVTGTGVNVSGTLNATGNANVGNLGTAGLITATGNITGGNINTAGKVVASTLESNVSTGTAPFIVASTTKVANLNADLLDGFSTATAATANTVVIRDADGSFSANIVTATLSGAATTAGTVTTAAQPNITSVGTLTGLGVNGNITAANITANTGVFTGNGSGLSALAGANVTGQVANAALAGTVYTNAQPNITSVGTLTSLAVTGNATAGNVYANAGTIGASLLTGTLTTAAQPNITSIGTLSSVTVTGNVAAGNLTTVGVLTVSGTGVSSIAGNLDMTSNTIINLAGPTNPSDAATKQYVDDVAQGLNVHDSCAAATPDTLANITGGTITYNNGTAGVGAFLATTGTFNLIDGVNVQTAGTRILVKNEANAVFNGIYTYTNTTAITRAVDFDSIPEVEAGDFTFITGGTLYDNTGWVQTESPTGIGTAGNNISFTQFSGAGTYQAGTGLTLLGSTFSVNASQTQVTSVGTLTGLNVNGNITAANITANTGVFTGNGSGLSAIAGGNVTGQVANAAVAGTVYTAAQPNITSVGTLTSLSVTGNVSAGNVSGTLLTGTLATASQPNVTSLGTLTGLGVNGTITGVNITANTGVFTGNGSGLSALAGANVTGQVANAAVAGTVYTAAQPNITSVGTLTSLTVTGNASAGNISTGGVLSVTGNANVGNIGAAAGVFTSVSGNGAALTDLNASNISTGTLAQARLANSTLTLGNTTLTLGGTTTTVAGLTSVTSTTFVGALTGAATTAGTVTTAAQPNITSLGTLTSLGVNGTVTAVAFTANTGVFTGNGSGLSAIAGANVTGTVSSATTAGTVTTAAQPNITSVGTLTSLSSSGNIVAPNVQANTGFFISSINAAVSAAGTAQGNATALTREINVTSTVASGAGVALPTAVAGMRVTIINTAANAVLVYPASGGTINSLALNAAFSQAAGARLDFIATTGTQWYTLNATYL